MKLHVWAAVVAAAAVLTACDRGTSSQATAPVTEVSETVVVETVATPAPTSAWATLQARVGSYPSDGASNFLEQGVLAERLQALLGADNYKELLENMGVASPLSPDGERLFVTGNRVHQGGSEMAAVVVDPAQNALRVWLVNQGKSQVFQDPEAAHLPWPADVQAMMDNYRAAHGK